MRSEAMSRVLVIDDQKSMLEILKIGLTRFGCSVETASGGYEGLRLFEEDLFDVMTRRRLND
jgi:CheY-like chemotaxis protein